MVMENLSSSLRETLKKLARANRIDEKTLNEVVRDIQRALLSADVNVSLVQQLSKRIKERALKEELTGKLNPRQHVINIVYHELESDLVQEMIAINDIANADQRLLVLDSSIGQQASEQARAFNEAISLTGVIVTKLDRTAKGGGALSAVAEVGTGIAFIGTGETIDDFEKFEPDRFISRLLGMGDIKTLVEMIEEEPPIEMEEAEAMLKGDFTLKDMYKQMEAIGKMGPLSKIVQMLPLGSLGVDIPDAALQSTKESLERFKVVMDSMTDEELEHPRIIRSSRIKRIARGSGVPTDNVRELLKYHKVMQRTMKGVRSQKDMQKFFRRQGLK